MLFRILIFAVFGLVIGSFSNVLIYRLPLEIPIGLSRSRCNDCGTQIKGYDNIPVLSYLLLKGKCRACKCKISLRYPLVELFICALWVVPVLLGQPTAHAVISALFTTILAIIAIIDYERLIIPDRLVVAIAVLSIPGFVLRLPPNWADRLIGALAGFGFLYLMAVLSEKILKKEGMGGGDIKLLTAAGLVLGWKNNMLSLGMGAFVALFMLGLMKLASHEFNREKQIPFAPSLAIAMSICYYFGDWLINWYLSFFIVPHVH